MSQISLFSLCLAIVRAFHLGQRNFSGHRLIIGGAIASCLASNPALPNSAATIYTPPEAGGFALDVGTTPVPLDIEKEDLLLDCDEERPFGQSEGVATCEFEATYYIVNRTNQTSTVIGAFYGFGLRDVSFLNNDGDANHTLTANDRVRIDRKLADSVKSGRFAPSPTGNPDFTETLSKPESSQFGFKISVKPRATSILKATGKMSSQAGFTRPGGYQTLLKPGWWTHPYMNREWLLRSQTDFEYYLEYLLYPLNTWKRSGPVTVRLLWNDDLTLKSNAMKLDNDEGEATATLDAKKTPVLDLALTREQSTILNIFQPGGPELRLGVRYGSKNRAPVASLGWNWSFGGFVMQSLSYEHGSDQYRAVVPMIAKVNLLVVGLGVGLPKRLDDDGRMGIRYQTGVLVPMLGITLFWDEYRQTGDKPLERYTGITVQLTI